MTKRQYSTLMICLGILVACMLVGFALLSLVYDGSIAVKVVVGLVVVVLSVLLLRSGRKLGRYFLDDFHDSGNESDDHK